MKWVAVSLLYMCAKLHDPNGLCGCFREGKNVLSLPGITLEFVCCPSCSGAFFIMVKKTQYMMCRVTHLPTLTELTCIFFCQT